MQLDDCQSLHYVQTLTDKNAQSLSTLYIYSKPLSLSGDEISRNFNNSGSSFSRVPITFFTLRSISFLLGLEISCPIGVTRLVDLPFGCDGGVDTPTSFPSSSLKSSLADLTYAVQHYANFTVKKFRVYVNGFR